MRLLLDTHIAVWAMTDKAKLPRDARVMIAEADAIVVSAAVIWELAIKSSIGRLNLDVDRLVERLEAAGAEHLSINWRHARAVADLPRHHHDPFDRILVAQAMVEPLHLITHDKTLGHYGNFVRVVW